MTAQKFFTIFFLIVLLVFSSYSQQLECGTNMADMDWLKKEIGKSSVTQSLVTSTRFFDVMHHIVRRSNGTGGLASSTVNELMNDLNIAYDDANVEFYSCNSISYINNDYYYDFDVNKENEIANAYNLDGSINVYYVGTYNSGGNTFVAALPE